jgi:hypothetical protein
MSKTNNKKDYSWKMRIKQGNSTLMTGGGFCVFTAFIKKNYLIMVFMRQ